MRISEIGGEFALIRRITDKEFGDSAVIKGVGDDCAVIDHTKDRYLLVTTDMMVENDHFNLEWQSPFQVGMKLTEANVSDILAMGGTPKYAFVSLSLKKETEVDFVEALYRGLKTSAERHGVVILGGDTTHGSEYTLNMALLGEVDKSMLRLRSMAQPDDLICVTGTLGGSDAGLKLLRSGKPGSTSKHLEPRCRSENEARAIAEYAHAMIDVSDGLASEVSHICEESCLGAEVYYEKIPISESTIEAGRRLSIEPQDFALYGGEDFELVFTIPEANLGSLRKRFSDFTVVGKMLPEKQGIYLLKGKERLRMMRGYDHFA